MESKRDKENQERWIGESVESGREEGNREKEEYEWERENGREYQIRLGWR